VLSDTLTGNGEPIATWRAVENTIGSKVVAYSPSPARGESCVSKCPWQVPTPKGVSNAKLTSRGWFLDADSRELI
jgi:hypothetical protein